MSKFDNLKQNYQINLIKKLILKFHFVLIFGFLVLNKFIIFSHKISVFDKFSTPFIIASLLLSFKLFFEEEKHFSI